MRHKGTARVKQRGMIIEPMQDSLSSSHVPHSAPLSGACALTNYGVIRAAGEDAVKFLQGQLTQDVAALGNCTGQLAAFCNAKGRMQASFIAFKPVPNEVLLVCSRDLIAQTVKRLSMFVMRAKVAISDATGEFSVVGLAGGAINSIAVAAGNSWAAAGFDAQTAANTAPGQLFRYPGQQQPCALWCGPPAAQPKSSGEDLSLLTWQWLEVQAGLAMVTLPIFETFVPQMLNYESMDGVNFKKGCYPGQEIVARSQFRGTLKRRTYRVACEAATPPALQVGQEVFDALDAAQPCGVVAAWGQHPGGHLEALVCLQTAAAEQGGGHALHLGAPSGQSLRLLELPYRLRDDI
jgi:tRNA-modifying protein YgfZ